MSTLGGRKAQDIFGEGGVLGMFRGEAGNGIGNSEVCWRAGKELNMIATGNVTGKDRKIHLETTTEVQVQAEVQM